MNHRKTRHTEDDLPVESCLARERSGGQASHAMILVMCFVLFLVVCKLYLAQYIEIRRLDERLSDVRRSLASEEQLLERTKKDVAFLATLDGVEKLAREKLKYIKKGEVIIVPVGSASTAEDGDDGRTR